MNKTSLAQGNQAFRDKDYQAAIRHYRNAIAAQPELQKILQKNIELAQKRLGTAAPEASAPQGVAIDIVVPVYNALPDVQACLASLDRCRDGFDVRVIIVNDGSEAPTTDWLRSFAKDRHDVMLIEHASNAGYTRAVNAGLKASTAPFVITQNSDTIVTPGWLKGMVACMESDPRIGIVGPLSNAANWQSVPVLRDEAGEFAVNELPKGLDVDGMAKLVAQVSERIYPRLPIVNGFCFMIRRAVIDATGYMDEESFPLGYGEETDFCIRAADAGFELAIADNVFVYHAKSRSFGHDRRKALAAQGARAQKLKHTPEKYAATQRRAEQVEALNGFRSRLLRALGQSFELADSNAKLASQPPEFRSGRDAFMLRGLRPMASIAVVLNLPSEESWSTALRDLSSLGAQHDLFLLGRTDARKVAFHHLTVSVTEVGDADTDRNARAFLRLAGSNVLDDYRAVLWLSPGEGSRAGHRQDTSLAEAFSADPDWGIQSTDLTAVKQSAEPALFTGLKTAMSRLGLALSEESPLLPQGDAIWIKPLLLRGLSTGLRPDELHTPASGKGFPGRATVLSLLAALAREAGMAVRTSVVAPVAKNRSAVQRKLKTIAFYLPQFHPIPENDLWWGKGFTEWTNVTRAKQLFRGHYQPRVPTELGYYDLRLEDTQVAQAELAREFGIHGFCYYYYWFNGKKLLNHPIEQMARSNRIDTGFCVCWANENWSRNWDGQNRHVLLEQTYTLESNIALIRELIPMMKDPRWIRHNGRPVMMVYRISIIPNWLETAAAWRDECRKAGIGEIHLCAVRFGLETLQGSPQDHGIDSYVLFPPHEAKRVDLRHEVHDLDKGFKGQIFDYTAVVDGDLATFSDGYTWPVHRGAMLGWDNTARRLTDARVFHGATPFGFRRWMKGILEQEQRSNLAEESLVFINAWNEWAEGTYLEPDQRWGRGYLRAFASAVEATPGAVATVLPQSVAAMCRGEHLTPRQVSVSIDTQYSAPLDWHAGERQHRAEWPTVMLCAHISGHQLFGGERSLLDVLRALAELPVNVVVTLPSGKNTAYIREVCALTLGVYTFSYPQWNSDRSGHAWLNNAFADIIALHAVDVVHANTIVLLEALQAASRMCRTRVIHARELISLDDPLRKKLGLDVTEIISRIFDRSDWIIGNSRATCKLFSRPGKTLYVPNAVTLADFDLQNKFGETIKFGIVSSNIPKKGVADFVEVARRVAARAARARFVVVGPINDQTRRWQEEVEQGNRPKNLSFVGYFEHPRRAMSEVNVLVNLSQFAESFGRTVAEGMAARRPVIAYDWGALSELVQNGETGFLVPYRDIDAVADAVVRFCENDTLIDRMGAAGRDFIARHFGQDALRSALTVAYEEILGSGPSSKGGRASRPVAAQIIGKPQGTTIVVPVYNAPSEVRNCLRSILKHTDLRRNRLLIIDDGSSDPEVARVLAEFKGASGVVILENKKNVGYTKTINRGINEAAGDDIVLLNSDTLVTPRWLEGLRSAAYAQENVATVTAMSDNAGAFSFPKFNEYCPKPDSLTHEEYALRILQSTQECSPPEVPTGSGFCMFIRRCFVEKFGLFDEEAFPRGYGEENDFCMRASKVGWRNLISPWSFVFHIRSASFKEEKVALVKAGVAVVTARYPDYAERVKAAFSAPEMIRLREASMLAVAG